MSFVHKVVSGAICLGCLCTVWLLLLGGCRGRLPHELGELDFRVTCRYFELEFSKALSNQHCTTYMDVLRASADQHYGPESICISNKICLPAFQAMNEVCVMLERPESLPPCDVPFMWSAGTSEKGYVAVLFWDGRVTPDIYQSVSGMITEQALLDMLRRVEKTNKRPLLVMNGRRFDNQIFRKGDDEERRLSAEFEALVQRMRMTNQPSYALATEPW